MTGPGTDAAPPRLPSGRRRERADGPVDARPDDPAGDPVDEPSGPQEPGPEPRDEPSPAPVETGAGETADTRPSLLLRVPGWVQVRNGARRPTSIAVACALLALLLGVLAANTARGPRGGVSTLVHVASTDKIAPLVRRDDPGFVFVTTGAHYDGTYYYAIARDPFARGRYHDRIDLPAKRYGHALYGQLAWLLSFGQAFRVPWALLLISLASLAAAAFWGSRFAHLLGWSPWAGLVVPLSPGLLYATTADTAEPLQAALVAGGLLAWVQHRRAWATVAFVAMSLTKEPLSLVPLGVLLFEAVAALRRRGWRPAVQALRGRSWLLPTVLCLAGPVVLYSWSRYVSTRYGQLPLHGNPTATTLPYTGLLETLRQAGRFSRSTFGQLQIGAVAIPLTLLLMLTMTVGIVIALRLRTLVDAAFLVTAPLMLLLNPANVLYPKDMLRLTVIPFLLLPGVLVRPRAVPAVPPSAAPIRAVRAH